MTSPDPVHWTQDEAIVAWSAFVRAHAAAVRAVEGDLRRLTGMALGWYDVLLELNAAPGRRLRMQELGEAAVLSRTRVSRLVDELVDGGHVCRQAHPDDRRSSYAVITTEGRRALRKAAPVYLDAVRRHFAGSLTPGQVTSVRVAMQAVLAASAPPRVAAGPAHDVASPPAQLMT